MITKSFDQGQVIFKKGDYSDCMYDILGGKVGVYSEYGTPDEKLIAELGGGETLGEMGMLEYYPRSATAVALEDGTVLAEIGEDELAVYFRDKPEKLFALMKLLSKRLRETTQKYADVCRVVYENDEAGKHGGEKSEWLNNSIEYYVGLFHDGTMY